MDDDPDQGLLGLFKSLIGKRSRPGNSEDLAEEIHDLVDAGQAKGLISNEESHMMYGVLDLKETKTHSIMVPRTEVLSAPIHSTLSEVIKLVTECGHTRIPIHKHNIDEIAGILHAKDLLKLMGEDPSTQIPPRILREPYFVPENKLVSELLKEMKEQKTHLAIVTDEYGGTAGIITIEDILEEIVGEILDEHDSEVPLLTVEDDGSLSVDARLEIEKLEEHLNVPLPKGDFESVGGFIIHLLGKIPAEKETATFGDFLITVTKADHRRIDKVRITRSHPAEPSQGEVHSQT